MALKGGDVDSKNTRTGILPVSYIGVLKLAEREGFEPSVELHTLHSLSRRAPSASRSSLRKASRVVLYCHVA